MVKRTLFLFVVVVLSMLITSKTTTANSTIQTASPVLYVGLTPKPQNILTGLVNTWYNNFDINISVVFANQGNLTIDAGTLRLSVSVPSHTWTTWHDYSITSLAPGEMYSSYFLFTPREEGLYTIAVDQSHTKTTATISSGFLPLDVSPSSAYTTLLVEVAGVIVAFAGVLGTLGIIGGRRRR